MAGKDYTFLHPEVIDEKCQIADRKLHLQNKINWEEFKVIIVPACKTISVSNLQKIIDFYGQGGTVIFTTRLPFKSLETGKDSKVVRLVQSVFPEGEKESETILTNNNGGKACFIAYPNGQKLREILKLAVNEFDVDYSVNEDLRYIHKVVDDRNIFYFANTGRTYVGTQVLLRGDMKLEIWDPHTGGIQKLITERIKDNVSVLDFTQVKLNLEPFHSCFLVEEKMK